VAVALVTPHERQAGGQGLLGGAQTLMGGVAALVAGELYQRFGRATAYTTCAVAMVALVGIGLWCVGRTWAARPPADDPEAVATVGA
jgi:predicted acyltransferase